MIFDPQTSYDPRLRTTAPRGPLCDAHGISELFYRTFPLVLVCMCVCVSMSTHDYAGVSVTRSKDNFGSSLCSSLTPFEAGSGYSPAYSSHLSMEAAGL